MYAASLTHTVVSHDYGRTWSLFNNGPALLGTSYDGRWQAAAMRPDATFGSAAPLWVTNTTGAAWTAAAIPNVTGQFFPDAAVSATGRVMAAVTAGYAASNLTISTDYGRTWRNSRFGEYSYMKVATSASGQFMTIAVFGNGILVSSDYGATLAHAPNIPGDQWVTVAVSCTGQYQAAAGKYGALLLSRDYGQTWHAPANPPGGSQWWWVDVSCSGQYVTAAAVNPGGLLAVSSDYGAHWTLTEQGRDWAVVSINKA